MTKNYSFILQSPTPRTDWNVDNGYDGSRMRLESYGQELVIDNVELEDGGQYECLGINEETQAPVRGTVQVSVEGRCISIIQGLYLLKFKNQS